MCAAECGAHVRRAHRSTFATRRRRSRSAARTPILVAPQIAQRPAEPVGERFPGEKMHGRFVGMVQHHQPAGDPMTSSAALVAYKLMAL